jgi:hypothetical protein
VAANGRRQKLSTTVAPEAYAYLESLVKAGRAASLAEAVDGVIERARRAENRARLQRDTEAYFARLSGRAAREEARLEASLGQLADEVSFDE